MDMLSFDLEGKFAHFRKYYANNTALSFAIPPRTTIMGLVAAILGLPRDSYYERLGPCKIRLGVRILRPVKKSFHRLNLLKLENDSDFRGQKGRVQTPFEMISGMDVAKDQVAYRIYVSPHSSGQGIYDELEASLAQKVLSYNLSLGPAFCIAALSNVKTGVPAEMREGNGDRWVPIASAIPVNMVGDIRLEDKKLRLEEELLPAAFIDDNTRELSEMNRVLFTLDGSPLATKVKGTYYEIHEDGKSVNITLLE